MSAAEVLWKPIVETEPVALARHAPPAPRIAESAFSAETEPAPPQKVVKPVLKTVDPAEARVVRGYATNKMRERFAGVTCPASRLETVARMSALSADIAGKTSFRSKSPPE